VLGVQAVAIPAVALFYNLPLTRGIGPLIGIAVLAAIGLGSIGTLFSAMAGNTRLAEWVLPMLATRPSCECWRQVLSLPLFVLIVLPAAQSRARLLAGTPAAEAMSWLRI